MKKISRGIDRECVCERLTDREKVCVCVRERERDRDRDKVCVRERERNRERERTRERERERERQKGRVQVMNSVNMSHVSCVSYISITVITRCLPSELRGCRSKNDHLVCVCMCRAGGSL